MGTTATILLLWAAFAASHMGLSSDRLRPRLVARLGERGFTALYSLLALAIFVPLVAVYFGDKHAGPLLWSLGGVPGVKMAHVRGDGAGLRPRRFGPGRGPAPPPWRPARPR